MPENAAHEGAAAYRSSGVDLAAATAAAEQSGLELFRDENGLALRRIVPEAGTACDTKNCRHNGDLTRETTEIFRGDFTRMIPRLRRNNLERELLVRAARIRHFVSSADRPCPVVLDATAGMGEDSLLLAAAGNQVEMYEQDPVIAVLLEDAMHRAAGIRDTPESDAAGLSGIRREEYLKLADAVARMHLHWEDSVAALQNLSQTGIHAAGDFHPDIIYLDPMFPERTKSAQVKHKFQILHLLEQPCGNETELLQAAAAAGPQKIIIKRPLKGPYLGGIRPAYSYSGKAIRYDVLINLCDLRAVPGQYTPHSTCSEEKKRAD